MIALLLDHLWQSSIFAGGAGLLALLLSRNSANARFWLWFTASAKFLLPFAILTALGAHFLTPIAPPLSAPALRVMAPIAQPFSGPEPIMAMPNLAAAPAATHLDLSFILLILWAFGFLAISARWMVRWRQLRLLLADAVPSPFAAPIAVKFSVSRLEPGLVGIFRPVILLPQGIDQQLTPAEMNAIVAHELCHWRRRDNLLAAFHMLVEALFWFFPLVWWLGARLNAERERACDESVLAAGNDPRTYAEGILKVCRIYLQSPLACAAGVSGAGLKKRIEIIMENKVIPRLNQVKKLLLAVAAMATLAAPLGFGLLTGSPALAPALAQTAYAPHPGTEEALRRQIEGWEKSQPVLADMTPTMVNATNMQQAGIQKLVDGLGALKSITFKENNDNDFDVYLVVFEKGSTVWTIAPLEDGKISGLLFQLAVTRTDKGPSPGVEAAVRRNYDALQEGAPAYDIMAPGLFRATNQQLTYLELNTKNLGAMKTLTFTRIDVLGWDVYAATFEHGTATFTAQPLVDGLLSGLLWSDILIPSAPVHPGTEAFLRRYIASLEEGAPNYDEMVPGVADSVKRQLPEILAMVKTWGALQSITFRGSGPRGADVYDVSFEHGKVEWYIAPLDADGKVISGVFHSVR